MTVLVIGWLLIMFIIGILLMLNNTNGTVEGLQFVAMLAGVLVIGVAGMFSIL